MVVGGEVIGTTDGAEATETCAGVGRSVAGIALLVAFVASTLGAVTVAGFIAAWDTVTGATVAAAGLALTGAGFAAAGPAEIVIEAWQLGQTAFMPARNASTSQDLRQRGHVSVRMHSAQRVRI
ncbi:MAG: hypothetical protein C0483_11665 [Pirellula sp.]|nr:hypothetical protein [Pirellula sp.]